MLLVVAPLVAVAVLGAVFGSRIEATLRQQAVASLETTLRATQEALRIWKSERKEEVRELAASPFFHDFLTADTAKPKPVLLHYKEWVVVNQEGQAINASGGKAQSLVKRDAAVLSKVLSGQAVLMPQESPTQEHAPTLLAGAPFVGATGDVEGALFVQIDPLITYSAVAQVGRIGESGETYFFDKTARMLTESRFTTQLRAIGLIQPSESSTLNVRIHDPGQNLTNGHEAKAMPQDLPMTQMALAAITQGNGSATDGYRDYRGVRVLGAWAWEPELGIGIATEIDEDEALVAYHTTRNLLRLALALTCAIAILTLIGLLTLRRQTRRRDMILAMFPDSNPMPVLRIAQPARVAYANDAARPLLNEIKDASGFLALPDWRQITADAFGDGAVRTMEVSFGKDAIYLFTFAPVPQTDILYAYGQDITQQKQAESHLRELSTRDALTDMPNRRRFDAFFAEQWRRLVRNSGQIALLFVDIDHFKKYNDHYGHQAGDACLQKVARVINAVPRRAGDLAARYGGEEFVVVLSLAKPSYAETVAQNLLRDIEALAIPHEESSTAPVVSITVGVATATPRTAPNLSPNDLIVTADKAMYEAKKQGRNRVHTLVADAASFSQAAPG